MENELKIKLSALTLDCKNPHALAEFYAKLLNWSIAYEDETYVIVGAPGTGQGGYPGITFQLNPAYMPPVWPEEPDKQQQMAHIDFIVNDMEKAVAHAVQCGAKVSEKQFSQDWTVLFDPAGHPFCLCNTSQVFDSPEFGLL
ncbi:MAG: VOC family protein [Clostridiales bacterium]|nr:VOC family protein [Clostridiales bacterium]